METIPFGVIAAAVGLLGGVVLGLAARLGDFCTLGAVETAVYGKDQRRLRLWGIVLGVAAGLAVSRLMQQVLFEVSPADPLIYLAVSGTLLLVAGCASWFPARRATRIDPVVALRME
mgnify:CR=1 FL=1